MDPSERQLHLGLHARKLRDSVAGGLPGGIAQQRGFSDARLAADDQDPALSASNPRQQPIEQLAPTGPAHEARLADDDHAHTLTVSGRPVGGQTDASISAYGSFPGRAARRPPRESIPGLPNTLCRWYSTVRGLRNNWVPTCVLVS